jgi:HTH-type transcriptional regulator/antitoxin HigA
VPDNNEFNPDWASPPGDTIADILEECCYSQQEFAQRMGYTPKHAHELLRSRAPISPETARKLELVLGATADFWLARDNQYRGNLLHSATIFERKDEEAWLKELPVKDMLRYGWLAPEIFAANPAAACLRFFGVADVQAWRATYRNVLEMSAFRTSPTFRSQPGALAAWLRQGEIESASLDCKPWDQSTFHKALVEMRTLTRKRDPRHFLLELKRRCADHGVAIAIVRAPAGCRASGATRFLSPVKALLLLSFRYLSDDQFWFTFFHEAGHLILHGKKEVFLEGGKALNVEELEANEFSAGVLVPPEFQSKLQRLAVERHEIRNFAKTIGVSPGVVLGQLQYRRRARPNQLNMLKARFRWG